MPKPLHEFYSFPIYASREDYRAKTGKDAPPWDPNKPLKSWEDPSPTNTDFDEIAGEVATYRPVLSVLPNGRYREGADGQPVTSSMRLSVEDAKSVNFLPAGGIVPLVGELYGGSRITSTQVANAQRTVPVPLNIPAGSRIVYSPGIQVPVVLMPGESIAVAASGFTDADRALLQRIAAKVGA